MSNLQDYLDKRGITEKEMEEAEKELCKQLEAYNQKQKTSGRRIGTEKNDG